MGKWIVNGLSKFLAFREQLIDDDVAKWFQLKDKHLNKKTKIGLTRKNGKPQI